MIDFLLSASARDALYLPAALVAAAIALWPFRERWPEPAGPAIAAGFLIGFATVRPLPLLPPVGGLGWLPYAMLAGLALGMAAERTATRSAATLAFLFGLPPALALLIGDEVYGSFRGDSGIGAKAGLALVGILAFTRLDTHGRSSRPIAIGIAGIALVALVYGSRAGIHSLTLLAVILTAAGVSRLGGRFWPRSASFAVASGHFALVATLALSSNFLAPPAILTLVPYFAPGAAKVLAGPQERRRLPLEIGLDALALLAAVLMLR